MRVNVSLGAVFRVALYYGFAGSLVEGMLRTLAPAVIGMLGAATFSLGRAALGVPIDVVIGVLAFILLVWRPISPMWLLVGGGLARLALRWSVAM